MAIRLEVLYDDNAVELINPTNMSELARIKKQAEDWFVETIIGLDKAEKEQAKKGSSKDRINSMSPEKRKRYEAYKARNK